MPFPLLLAPLLSSLASKGMSLLAGAIEAKGKDIIESKLGIKIPSSVSELTPELVQKLKQAEMEHEEFLLEMQVKKAEIDIEAEKSASIQVTDRWKADMTSDSWISKNIRPLTLIFILAIYTIFALMSAFDVDVNESYVELLGQWGMLIMSAYFVGRTVEKGIASVKKPQGKVGD